MASWGDYVSQLVLERLSIFLKLLVNRERNFLANIESLVKSDLLKLKKSDIFAQDKALKAYTASMQCDIPPTISMGVPASFY